MILWASRLMRPLRASFILTEGHMNKWMIVLFVFGSLAKVAHSSPETDKFDWNKSALRIDGGTFLMGVEDGYYQDKPVHEVHVASFYISKDLISVAQYGECVAERLCTEPQKGYYCNWGVPGAEAQPIRCVDWNQAKAYARFAGGRLPSEAEFEFAVKKSAIVAGSWEWIEDVFHGSYTGAPSDGSAWENPEGELRRVIRGGSFARSSRTDLRSSALPDFAINDIGFRVVRSAN